MKPMTPEELELARVHDLARVLWAELKDCDWPMTRLGLALAEAEDRGRAAALTAARQEEREACLAAVESERLLDHTGHESDIAYNHAIDDALAAIRARARGGEGGGHGE